MRAYLHVTVHRRIDNWYEGLPDDAALALALHHRRRQAVERALAVAGPWHVSDWGHTAAPEASYAVELRLTLEGDPGAPEAELPALTWLGELLDGDQVPRATSNLIKALIGRFWLEQRAEHLRDVTFALPGGQKIRCDPDGERMLITVELRDGRRLCFLYHATEAEIEQKRTWSF